jgi:hypothetical protein
VPLTLADQSGAFLGYPDANQPPSGKLDCLPTFCANRRMNWETVVDIFKALLTPAIALLAVLIAVAQYLLAKAKFRHELYERRSAVFKATMKFIAQVTSGGNAKLDELQTFLRDTSEAPFLFTNKQIPPFLDSLYKRGADLYTTKHRLEGPPEARLPSDSTRAYETANDLKESLHKLLLWFGQQFDECRRLFAKDLSLV